MGAVGRVFAAPQNEANASNQGGQTIDDHQQFSGPHLRHPRQVLFKFSNYVLQSARDYQEK
jgi:hypothetical protein